MAGLLFSIADGASSTRTRRRVRDRARSLFLFALLASLPCAAGAIPDIAPGHWYEVPNSKLRSVAATPSPAGDFAAVVMAWNGAALDTTRNQLLVWGGGHSDYAGNEVYAFDLNDLQWKRLSEPSVASPGRDPLYPDGQPRARHTYNYIEYLPNIDRLVSFGGSAPWPDGGGEFTRQVSEFDLDTRRWTTGQRAAVPATGSMISSIARYDAGSGDVFFVGGMSGQLARYSPAGDAWKLVSGTAYLSDIATGAIDPERRILVAVGHDPQYGGAVRQAWRWGLDGGDAPVDMSAASSGDSYIERQSAPGFVYHAPSRNFVGWSGGTDLFLLDPGTWQWTRVVAAQGNSVNPGPAPVQGTYGRFQYVPKLDLFVLVNGVDQNVFLYRAAWKAGQTSPVVTLKASPMVITAGEALSLSWEAASASQCAASGGWQGEKSLAGNESIPGPAATTTYTLQCRDDVGRTSAAQVVVQLAGSAATPRVNLVADHTSVTPGDYAVLSWTSSGSDGCVASGGWTGPRGAQGSETVGPINAATEFALTCDSASGAGYASQLLTLVNGPTVRLTSTPRVVSQGDRVKLEWSASPGSVCTADGDWSGPRFAKGSELTRPVLEATEFILTCVGAGGAGAAKAAVDVRIATKVAGPENSGPFGIGSNDGLGFIALLSLVLVRRNTPS